MTLKHVHEKGSVSLEKLVEKIKLVPDFRKVGAIAIFIGVVRGETNKEGKVQKLAIEAYEEKAESVLSEICCDLKRGEGIVDVQIHHFLGEFNVGEDLVYVLVAGSHRRNVFSALTEAVERYKREAPIFKKEYLVTQNGKMDAYWVSEEVGKGET